MIRHSRKFTYINLLLLIFAAGFLTAAAPYSPGRHANSLKGQNAAIEQAMVPHKALYKVKMVSRQSGSPVLNISGQMFYEWRRGCEAWTTDHRFKLFYEYADSAPMEITSDFSTYESFDGESFNFSSRRTRNGELFEELRGQAQEIDGVMKAVYTKPTEIEYTLPPATLFPMAHTIDLLKYAKEGNTFFNAPIFDGSDDQGPVEVNAFIGPKTNALAKIASTPGLDKNLLDTQAWQIRMAFFPIYKPEAESEYEMDIVFHENGLISDMRVDYKDFSVTQKLVALEKLTDDTVSCNGAKSTSGPKKK